ncbi:MAG: MFS transporter [Actinomycetota bacterium]
MFEGDNKREKILVLLTMCFALFMAMLDNTVVNVALPKLSEKLGAGVSGLQWIVDGYVLAFASLMLTGGILGDRYGRKRTFLTGLGLFTIFSLMCGLSGTSGHLIAFRGLQGIGGALLMPGTLSIITVTFPAQERAKAIGIWAGVSGLALSIGPTLGGWLVENVGWQSVFFLNVPIGIVGFIVGMKIIKESRSEHARQLDIPGLLLGTGALFSMTYGLIEANQLGWSSPVIIGSLVGAAAIFGVFLTYERRASHPMIPLNFFRIPAFSAGNSVAFSISLGMFGTFFFMSLYLQLIRGYSAFRAGLSFLPLTAMIVIAAPLAGRYASKHGSRAPMVLGPLMAGTGLLLGSLLHANTSFAFIFPMFMLMGFGMGITMTPMTAAVMNSVGAQRAGMGSAMTNTSREVGGVFGIALLGTLLTTRLKGAFASTIASIGLQPGQKDALVSAAGHGTLDPTLGHRLGLTPAQGLQVQHSFGAAWIQGFHLALIIAGAALVVAAIISSRFIPRGAPQREHVSGMPADVEPVAAH